MRAFRFSFPRRFSGLSATPSCWRIWTDRTTWTHLLDRRPMVRRRRRLVANGVRAPILRLRWLLSAILSVSRFPRQSRCNPTRRRSTVSKGENLANVAASLNHEGFVGMMCHDSVAECLIKAAVLPHNGVLWLRQQFAADPRKLWTQIYANKQDQRVTRQSIHAYGYGLIVGFYPPGIDLIYHSMIAVGGGVLAGSNNLGVGGQLNYHMISVDGPVMGRRGCRYRPPTIIPCTSLTSTKWSRVISKPQDDTNSTSSAVTIWPCAEGRQRRSELRRPAGQRLPAEHPFRWTDPPLPGRRPVPKW